MKDLVLTVRERLVRKPLIVSDTRRETFGERRAYISAAIHDFFECEDQFFRGALFGEIPGRPGFEGADCKLLFLMHCQDENRSLGKLLMYIFQRIEPITTRQGNIEDRDIPLAEAGEFKGPGCAFGLTGDLHTGFLLYDLFETPSHNGMVVGDEHPDHGTSRFTQSKKGGRNKALQ